MRTTELATIVSLVVRGKDVSDQKIAEAVEELKLRSSATENGEAAEVIFGLADALEHRDAKKAKKLYKKALKEEKGRFTEEDVRGMIFRDAIDNLEKYCDEYGQVEAIVKSSMAQGLLLFLFDERAEIACFFNEHDCGIVAVHVWKDRDPDSFTKADTAADVELVKSWFESRKNEVFLTLSFVVGDAVDLPEKIPFHGGTSSVVRNE